MSITWREACEADIPECLDIEPRNAGDEIVGRDTAVAMWKDLIRSRSFHSNVMRSANDPGRIVAFGASVFVTAKFATQEIERPSPRLNDRIFASIANGASVVRPEVDLYNTAVDDALDVVVLYGNWLDGILSPEQLQEVQMLLAVGFVQLHAGYRLNRILVGTVGDVQGDYQETSGVIRVVQRFADSERRLAVMTRADAFSVSGSLAASLFQYQAPILGLRDSEKHLLAEALTQRSDGELAARMNLSPATIKKRWQALFEKIADVHPEMLVGGDDKATKGFRGPQKRHHILAYVRSHPQELRPYRWRLARDT